MKRHLVLLLTFVLLANSVYASDKLTSVNLFDMGAGCKLKGSYKNELMAEIEIYEWLNSYIAPPKPGQNRDRWLEAIREYRQSVRDGSLDRDFYIDMIFDGVRSWVRFDVKFAKMLSLIPGQELQSVAEARWISGNNELCLAFDKQNDTDSCVGWTGITGTVLIPQDSKWHSVNIVTTVPEFDTENNWLRPIIGMDGTRNKTPGHIEIRSIDFRIEDEKIMSQIENNIGSFAPKGIDRSLYDEPSQQWIQSAFTCHFTFMYDTSFYNTETGKYKLDSFIKDGKDEFGGYDILLLWHAYPRIGVDGRNQLDFYRDMPGGVEGIRKLVNDCHEHDVTVFINYNPWDTGTAREGKTDADFLVEFVAQTQVDGIFLDTMFSSDTIRQKLEEAKPGIVLCPEGGPPIKNLSSLNGSWAQWSVEKPEYVPSLDHRKWIEPRHMRWQIWRWMPNHRQEIRRAFFNGSGMLVWENIFGAYNPWPKQDRRMWRKAVKILKHFRKNFTSDSWDPYYPNVLPETLTKNHGPDQEVPGLYINRWPGDDCTVFTLFVKDRKPLEQTGGRIWYKHMSWPLFEVSYKPNMSYYDLWNGNKIEPEKIGNNVRVNGFIDRFSGIGCVLEIKDEKIDNKFLALLEKLKDESLSPLGFSDNRNFVKSVIEPEPIARTDRATCTMPPKGMVYVSGGRKHIHINHMRRECGCYPDPGTPADQWEKFLWGDIHNNNIIHDYYVDIDPYFIDETEVTNADFEKFLNETGYKPKFKKNFLKHWPNGKMPKELALHPVVYVDIDDAKAYAKWAGKRLPTEQEWHLAAEGVGNRKWPWGNEFDQSKCNMTGDKTMPVKSLPEGKSPYGCYHMSGNVWELTDSVREDGHTRFLIIRGGSYFKAKGSGWYVPGGPRSCDDHTKFILMWPGLDRCSTIGFRCVVDANI